MALARERADEVATTPERRLSGALLLLAVVLNLAGVVVYSGRVVYGWFADSPTLLAWERSLIIAFFVAAALGVALLEAVVRDAAPRNPVPRVSGVPGGAWDAAGWGWGPALARVGATAFLLGAAAALVTEATELAGGPAPTHPPALQSVMVVVLFVAEALLGAALLAGHVLARWVGWAAVAWNLGWLLLLPLASPGGLYYPILHAIPLLPIAIPLVRAPRT